MQKATPAGRQGFAYLIPILIGMLILGIGFIYLNQSGVKNTASPITTVISRVNTYTNSQLGFEFQYAKDLTAKEDSEEQFDKRGNGNYRKNFKGYIWYEPGKVLGAAVVLDKNGSYDTNPFTIWVFDNPDNEDIENWYKNYWYYPFVWGDFTQRNQNVAPVNESTVSGQMAKSGIVDYREGKPKFVYISNYGKMYLLRIIGDEGDKILESFKFLE